VKLTKYVTNLTPHLQAGQEIPRNVCNPKDRYRV